MTHEDAGHYAAKHPPGTACDPEIVQSVKSHLKDGMISCAAVHKIARERHVTPAEIGKAVDLQEYRLCKCQLGLFGYGPEKKRVRPADTVPPELADAIRASLVNERLPCASGWALAKAFNLPKMEISAACETLHVKIKPCQIGAF